MEQSRKNVIVAVAALVLGCAAFYFGALWVLHQVTGGVW
jgi:hypothetical protein